MSDGKGTKPEKRKSRRNDAAGGAQKKPREVNGDDTAVKEEEVEEFFEILSRIHGAVNYFKNGNGDYRNLTGEGSLLLALELESTDVVAVDDNDGVKGIKDVKGNVGFDLNVEPDEDPDSNPGTV